MCSIKRHFGGSLSEQNENPFQIPVPFQVQMNVPGAGTGMTSAYSTAYSTGTALTGWSGTNSQSQSRSRSRSITASVRSTGVDRSVPIATHPMQIYSTHTLQVVPVLSEHTTSTFNSTFNSTCAASSGILEGVDLSKIDLRETAICSETVSALSSEAPVPPGHDRPLSFSPPEVAHTVTRSHGQTGPVNELAASRSSKSSRAAPTAQTDPQGNTGSCLPWQPPSSLPLPLQMRVPPNSQQLYECSYKFVPLQPQLSQQTQQTENEQLAETEENANTTRQSLQSYYTESNSQFSEIM